MEPIPKRKYIRLPPASYADPAHVFSITIDTPHRARLFARSDSNDAIVAELKALAQEKCCPIKIYCLMPSHLHLLISPGRVSVVRWVALFKQRTQHLARISHGRIEKGCHFMA